MPPATVSLPSDAQALRALAASLQAALAAKERELAARDAEIHAETLHIEKLRATLALMKRARFGQSCERLEPLIGDLEEETAEQEARVEHEATCIWSSTRPSTGSVARAASPPRSATACRAGRRSAGSRTMVTGDDQPRRRARHQAAGPRRGRLIGSPARPAAAILDTLIQTATVNGLDPEADLRDLLAGIADHPINRIDDLRPWPWAASPRTVAAA